MPFSSNQWICDIIDHLPYCEMVLLVEDSRDHHCLCYAKNGGDTICTYEINQTYIQSQSGWKPTGSAYKYSFLMSVGFRNALWCCPSNGNRKAQVLHSSNRLPMAPLLAVVATAQFTYDCPFHTVLQLLDA